jgi:hypothetical protein
MVSRSLKDDDLDFGAIKVYWDYTPRLFDIYRSSVTTEAQLTLMANSILLSFTLTLALSVIPLIRPRLPYVFQALFSKLNVVVSPEDLMLISTISLMVHILSFILFSLLSIYHAVSVIRVHVPKVKELNEQIRRCELMNFRVVNALKDEEFRQMMRNLDKEKLLDLYTMRMKWMAKNLVVKYRHLRFAVLFFAAALALFAIFIIESMLLVILIA